MSHIQFVDGLVKEYLLFRGLPIKLIENEIKNDKDKGFRADKIVEQIVSHVNSQDLQSLKDLWINLENHFFNKLEHTFISSVKKLESAILKYYLITAYTANKNDKINEFFMKLSIELQNQSEWKDWFYFPFCKNPDEHPTFSVYFTRQWLDTLLLSLHNFLSTVFQCVPQPTLSKFENETNLIQKLQEENVMLRSRLQSLNNSSSPQISSSSTVLSNSENQKKGRGRLSGGVQNDVNAIDVPPPPHIIDDFYIIATETNSINQISESQTRGLKSLIRNMSSGGSSPIMGRKELALDKNKRRSGSVGRNWM